jgi:hypothetical protein
LLEEAKLELRHVRRSRQITVAPNIVKLHELTE